MGRAEESTTPSALGRVGDGGCGDSANCEGETSVSNDDGIAAYPASEGIALPKAFDGVFGIAGAAGASSGSVAENNGRASCRNENGCAAEASTTLGPLRGAGCVSVGAFGSIVDAPRSRAGKSGMGCAAAKLGSKPGTAGATGAGTAA